MTRKNIHLVYKIQSCLYAFIKKSSFHDTTSKETVNTTQAGDIDRFFVMLLTFGKFTSEKLEMHYFFCVSGFNRSCRVSATVASADCIAWAYILPVVVTLACPRRLETVCRFVPAAMSKVAVVWRSECSEILGMSFTWTNFENHPETVSG